ncbi:MAG TPA: GNAT family N-acetyltransferase [Gammaproteobacteria bacterium]|nr:GNAT family N-acetyltransferase [Gammaproteobacteria bacterium]
MSEAGAVRHDRAARRFEIVVDGRMSYLSYTSAGDGTIDLRHTFVPAELRGRGIASRIVERALEHAREHGLKVIPTCPFVAAYLRRHPEHEDLRA